MAGVNTCCRAHMLPLGVLLSHYQKTQEYLHYAKQSRTARNQYEELQKFEQEILLPTANDLLSFLFLNEPIDDRIFCSRVKGILCDFSDKKSHETSADRCSVCGLLSPRSFCLMITGICCDLFKVSGCCSVCSLLPQSMLDARKTICQKIDQMQGIEALDNYRSQMRSYLEVDLRIAKLEKDLADMTDLDKQLAKYPPMEDKCYQKFKSLIEGLASAK